MVTASFSPGLDGYLLYHLRTRSFFSKKAFHVSLLSTNSGTPSQRTAASNSVKPKKQGSCCTVGEP